MSRPANDIFLRALRREPTPYTPIWIMRQAGRYLPEYNETRRRAGSFLALMKNPDLACEVTLQPLARFRLDAAIVFSDILTIPDAMGLGLYFADGEGPKFERPLRDEQQIRALSVPDPTDRLRYVLDAVSACRRALAGSVPLIGFSGSPYTLACYMIEGGGSDDFRHAKALLYSRPDLMHALLELNAHAVGAYLSAQLEAGAQALMIFDSWGGSLAHQAYREFSLRYLEQAIAAIRQPTGARVPVIVFGRNTGPWLEELAGCGADAVGLDWPIDIGAARRRVGDRVALQGNLDPAVLFAGPERIRAQVAATLAGYGPGHGHVFNLGHGISRHTDPDRVEVLVDAVHDLSRPYHA